MGKRAFIMSAAIVALVLAAALGGLRAHQVLAENTARGHMETARAAALTALNRATAAGLHRTELAPYRAQLDGIATVRTPPALGIWASNQADFYDRQAAAYRTLLTRIAAVVKQVTVETSQKTARRIAKAEQIQSAASEFDVDTSTFAKNLTAEKQAAVRARTPGQYRTILRDLHVLIAGFEPQVQARERAVSALVSSAHGSLQAIDAHADASTATARQSITLLSLFTTRGKAYDTQLTALSAAVHAQTSLQQAAVKTIAVDDLAAQIAADYQKTVPAKLILVSTEDQSARLYEHGKQIYSTPVTTGGPELPTDHGVFHMYFKASPYEFHSPWPPSSPYYYPPTPVQFWMPFDGGEGLHDASWRSNFGPGSNLQPTDLGTGNYILGTHGCVNLPYDAAQFIWNWAPVGTTVAVI